MLLDKVSLYKGPDISGYIDALKNPIDEVVPDKISLAVAKLAIGTCYLQDDFIQVKRMPNNSTGEDENDAEHSWSVEMLATEIARTHYPEFDLERISAFSRVHDLLEVKVGDVATFHLSPAQLQEKERREHAALEELLEELPEGIASDLRAYEMQGTTEARFVRAVDKLMPLAKNIACNDMSNLRYDYGISDVTSLQERHAENIKKVHARFNEEFPAIVDAYAILCKILEDKFSQAAHEIGRADISNDLKGITKTELKYLIDIDDLPDLSTAEQQRIIQAYIEVNPDGSTTRIRSINNTAFEWTILSHGTIERRENTSHFHRPQIFNALLGAALGQVIEKTRYITMEDGTRIELDVYHRELEGLAVAEVTFTGRPSDVAVKAATFVAPPWFRENVSQDLRYKKP